MNTLKIEGMPAGREMDALVWLALHGKPANLFECRYVDGDVQPHADYPAGHISPPHYSTEVSDAWIALEYFKGEGKHYEIGHHISDTNKVYVAFGGEFVQYEGWGDYEGETLADSFPLAICRAALIALIGYDNGN